MMIVLLLSAVMIHTKQKLIEKPIIVIVSDNSKSVTLSSDSLYFKESYKNDIESIQQELSNQADVFLYEFDSELKTDISYSFNGDQTNLSDAFENILLRYEGRNIAGMILLSDGIFNTGSDPSALAENIYFPVYSVGFGDTTIISDVEIKSVRYNKVVGFGNRFPIEVVIHAKGLNGKKTTLKITKDGKEVATESIQISSNMYSETKTFVFEAGQKGLNRYEITIEQIADDLNKANNYSSAIVQVTEKKNTVAILYQAPHPDITALKSAMEDTRNFEIETFQISGFNAADIQKYDAIVLFQLPDKKGGSTIADQVVQSKTPYLMMVGQNTDIRKLSQMNSGLKIQQTSQAVQEAQPQINASFNLFQSSTELQRDIRNFPPLITHFGNYTISENFQVYMYQKIGNVQTTNPMIAFSVVTGKTSAFLVGEGIYKWKLQNYLLYGNHQLFNEIFQKVMNLLVQQADKRRLKIHHKDIYYTTENAEITAELYNMSMEMIANQDVFIRIQNENGLTSELKFVPQLSDYKLQLGRLKPGKYTWNAYTNFDGQKLESQGVFFVENVFIEQMNTTANHNLLKYFASMTNGKFYEKNSVKEISKNILENSDLKNIEYLLEDSDYLISFRWILIILIVLLCVEWAARKYLGSY